MQIFISESALADLEDIKEYYSEQGATEIGLAFVSSILEHIEMLKEYPNIGRMVPEFNEEHIREIIHPPFRVVYLREEIRVQIIRIWRSERQLVLLEGET